MSRNVFCLYQQTLFRWKSRFYLMSRNPNTFLNSSFPISWKSRFYLMSRNTLLRCDFWIHIRWKSRFYLMSRNIIISSFSTPPYRWKSRFYLMSRNPILHWFDSRIDMLEKPVLFDVTEPARENPPIPEQMVGKAGFIWCHGTISNSVLLSKKPLEKPVLFDVTEPILFLLVKLFMLLEKPVLFDVTEHNDDIVHKFNMKLEKPVLFDVTERWRTILLINIFNSVGKAGFIWCHGTAAEVFAFCLSSSGWKSRFYLMSRNIFLFGLFVFFPY